MPKPINVMGRSLTTCALWTLLQVLMVTERTTYALHAASAKAATSLARRLLARRAD